MSIARKILSNTAWQIIGKVVTALLGIISIKFITNYLSTTEYGEYTAIYDFVAIFAIVADFGLFTMAVREMANDEKRAENILGNILSIRTIIGILSLGLGVAVAFLIPKYQGTHIPFGIPIVAGATLLMLMSGIVASILQLHLKMQWFSIGMLAGKLVAVIYIVAAILVWFPDDPMRGFPHLLYGWIYGNILTFLITYFPARKLAKIRPRFDFSFWKEVIFKTLPYGFALLLGVVYFRTGSVLMSFFGMRHEVGIYGVPMKILEIADLIPVFFMNSILPVLTRSLKENESPGADAPDDLRERAARARSEANNLASPVVSQASSINKEKAGRIIQYAFEFMALAAFPLLLGGLVLAKPLVAGVSSDAFLSTKIALGADAVLAVLLFAMTLVYFHVCFGFTLISLGLQRKILIVNAIAAAFNIIMNLIFIPRYAFMGVAFIAVATELIILIGNFALVRSRFNFWPRFGFFWKALFSAMIMAAVIFFVEAPLRHFFALKSLLIVIPLGGLLYLGGLIFTRAFTPEMLSFIKKPKDAAETAAPPESFV